jgi:hypothetical protein
VYSFLDIEVSSGILKLIVCFHPEDRCWVKLKDMKNSEDDIELNVSKCCLRIFKPYIWKNGLSSFKSLPNRKCCSNDGSHIHLRIFRESIPIGDIPTCLRVSQCRVIRPPSARIVLPIFQASAPPRRGRSLATWACFVPQCGRSFAAWVNLHQ